MSNFLKQLGSENTQTENGVKMANKYKNLSESKKDWIDNNYKTYDSEGIITWFDENPSQETTNNNLNEVKKVRPHNKNYNQ